MELISYFVFALFWLDIECSTELFEDGQVWGGKVVGRPAKVIIDEIITRSITFPAPKGHRTKGRSNNFDPNRWAEKSSWYDQGQGYQQSSQLLTPNRRQEDNANSENNMQFEDDDIVLLESEDGTLSPIEKTIHLVAEAPSSTSQPDGGIHIHVQEKALNAFFDKIPWEDLMDSFNNKLTQKHEIRQVREHIFSDADQKSSFDHTGWNDFGQEKTRVATNSYRPGTISSNPKRVISSNKQPTRSWNYYGKPSSYYPYGQRRSEDFTSRRQKPKLCSIPSYSISRDGGPPAYNLKTIEC